MTVVLYPYGHYLIGKFRGNLVREHDTRILMRTDIKKNYELIDNPRVEGANADAVVCRRVADMSIPERQLRSSGALIATYGWRCRPKEAAQGVLAMRRVQVWRSGPNLLGERHLDREIKRNTLK
jgi:hypothetical protein